MRLWLCVWPSPFVSILQMRISHQWLGANGEGFRFIYNIPCIRGGVGVWSQSTTKQSLLECMQNRFECLPAPQSSHIYHFLWSKITKPKWYTSAHICSDQSWYVSLYCCKIQHSIDQRKVLPLLASDSGSWPVLLRGMQWINRLNQCIQCCRDY